MKDKNNKHSIINNLKYSYKYLIQYEGKNYFKYAAANVISSVVCPFLEIFLPSFAVFLFTSNMEIKKVFLILLSYMVLLQVIKLISVNSEDKLDKELLLFRTDFFYEINKHILYMNYEMFESPEGQKKADAALPAIYYGDAVGIQAFLSQVTKLIINVLGLIIYSLLAAKMNIWIFIFIIISTAVVSLFNVRAGNWQHKNKDSLLKIYHKFKYLCSEVIATKNGKDIRLYGIKDWFLQSFSELLKSFSKFHKKLRGKYFSAEVVNNIMGLIRDGFVYVYLIYEMMKGKISVDKFILYVGVVAGFGVWMNGIFSAIQKFIENSVIINSFRDFMEYGCISENTNCMHIDRNKIHEIRLENVSYKYQGADEYTLKNINLTIKPGEKLALVGINGAGKTTIVKLICGLYKPTKGKIYIDGIDASKVNRREYFKEFAVVFQDMAVFAFPIESNVACSKDEEIDREMLNKSLKKADLFEKVDSLPKKTKTSLLKDLDKNGVELSGGETQKLMLAMALYKDASIIILDEPTAALDPIAESEMYERYNSFAKNKTSIFISHRLSSTRFCDRIIFLNNGEIEEEGTHESLIKKNGKYSHMFEVQSHYYKSKEIVNSF